MYPQRGNTHKNRFVTLIFILCFLFVYAADNVVKVKQQPSNLIEIEGVAASTTFSYINHQNRIRQTNFEIVWLGIASYSSMRLNFCFRWFIQKFSLFIHCLWNSSMQDQSSKLWIWFSVWMRFSTPTIRLSNKLYYWVSNWSFLYVYTRNQSYIDKFWVLEQMPTYDE